MRRHQIHLAVVLFALIAIVGCKVDPAPPSVDDAKVVWSNINKQLGLDKELELVDLKKTDGQMAEVNGVKVYTFYYEVRKRHLTRMGNWKPGDIETVQSNYGFQKTENGWQGPEGTHFPH